MKILTEFPIVDLILRVEKFAKGTREQLEKAVEDHGLNCDDYTEIDRLHFRVKWLVIKVAIGNKEYVDLVEQLEGEENGEPPKEQTKAPESP